MQTTVAGIKERNDAERVYEENVKVRKKYKLLIVVIIVLEENYVITKRKRRCR